jgi:hypothetical protein
MFKGQKQIRVLVDKTTTALSLFQFAYLAGQAGVSRLEVVSSSGKNHRFDLPAIGNCQSCVASADKIRIGPNLTDKLAFLQEQQIIIGAAPGVLADQLLALVLKSGQSNPLFRKTRLGIPPSFPRFLSGN